MKPIKDLTGRRFGLLVCIEPGPRVRSDQRTSWLCLCDCGQTVVKETSNLQNASPNASCGCQLNNGYNFKHGESLNGGTPEYQAWASMKRRCYNPNCEDYQYYGARGITVCERWRKNFSNFLADMGRRPEGLTLDRENVNGNYEPLNCRWVDAVTQSRNRRNIIQRNTPPQQPPTTEKDSPYGPTQL